MSNTTDVKIKNRLWRRLSTRVNRKNIQRLATNFRHTLGRIFCMGNGQPSTEAEREQGDDAKSVSDRVSLDAGDVNTETPRSNPDVETDMGDEESSNSDQDGATYDADIESEAADTPRIDGQDAEAVISSVPGHAGTRVNVIRQLQKQMFMEDTFTAAKPPLPPRGNRAPFHCTRPVCYTRPVKEVAPLAPPQKQVAPPQETEVAQQNKNVAEKEEVEEKPIEDMTEEDIDDIINEIMAC